MDEAIRSFKSKKIPVLERTQAEYDKAIATSNLLFRFSRPDCVVRPETAAHVQEIIKQARSKNLKVTIKCNGHSYAGHSTAFQGISLDLRSMKKVELDMKSMTVSIEGGCQWGRVYATLVNGGYNGFVINGGRCPTVGVSGFILGGGLSPFTRSFGMGSDTLQEASIVTADGKLVTVSERDDPRSDKGRLFWALQGAGGGNFGVLVKMKLKVQKLSNRSGIVVAGRYQWFPTGGFTNDVMDTMNDFYVAKWPNKMTIDTTWICDLRQAGSLGGVRFTVTFNGSKEQFDTTIDKYFKNDALKEQLKRRVLPEKSTRYLYETLANQWFEELERAYPSNKTYELYSSFVFNNKDKRNLQKVTAALRDLMAAFRNDFRGEQVNLLFTWIHSGGKATEKAPTASAYFWREAVFHMYVTVEWVDKWMERDMRRFIARVKRELRPFSLNKRAAFINFPDRDFGQSRYERAYFGDNREELRQVKRIWDKDDFFNWEQGVRLPGGGNRGRRRGGIQTFSLLQMRQTEMLLADDDSVRQRSGLERFSLSQMELGGDDTGSERGGEEADSDDEDNTDQLAAGQWDSFQISDLMADSNELADVGPLVEEVD